MIEKLAVFYFTGTGNAKAVACWVKQKYEDDGGVCTVYSIAEWLRAGSKHELGSEKIVICYPTHGFNAPRILYQFLRQLAESRSTVYLINTRAGMLIGRWNTPGLSGIALLWPALLLKLKGFQVKGISSVDLPSNWLSIHPAIRPHSSFEIFRQCKPRVEKFVEEIERSSTWYSGWWSLPLDLLTIPIALMYYGIGRFVLAKTFFASSKCDACSLCVAQCPVSAIVMKNGRPYWTFKCESCMHCMNHCPTRAIETPHFWIFLIWSTFFMVLGACISWISLKTNLEVFRGVYADLIHFLITIPLALAFAWISYHLLHLLACYSSLFRWFITKTSLTHYTFWGRYQPPK